MFKKTVATREKVKLKVGISGPSGSGKTYSALQLGYGITGDWSKITVVDTENKTSLYYAGERSGPWNHIDFSPTTVRDGFHPKNWVEVIKMAEADGDTEVLILDSASMEWAGEGGCLDIVETMPGYNQMDKFKKVTPLHQQFLNAILHSQLNIIVTCRTKTAFNIDKDDKGKTKVEKVGLDIVQRPGFEYEFDFWFDLSPNHYSMASKDRTGIFSSRGYFQISPLVGQDLIGWSRSAVSVFSPEDAQMMDRITETLTKTGLLDYQDDIVKELTGEDFVKEKVTVIVKKYMEIKNAAVAKAAEEAKRKEIEDEHPESSATPEAATTEAEAELF